MKNKHVISAAALAALLWGATASATTYVVTKTTDTNDGTCDADCSLREAITAANNNPGDDIITLPAGTYTITINTPCEDNNVGGDFDVWTAGGSQSLTINGAGIGQTFIDGGAVNHANGVDRVFDIVNVSPAPPPPALAVDPRAAVLPKGLVLNNLTVQNGDAHEFTSSCVDTGEGGGIRVNNPASLTINSVAVKNNTANSTVNSGEGGGIGNEGTTIVNQSLITGNQSDSNGGGIYSGSCPSLTVTNTAISGNSTTQSGGGVYTDCSTSTILNSTVSTNTADLSGGGVADAGLGILNLRNDTVTNNIAANNGSNSGEGGGAAVILVSTGAKIVIRNTIIAGNSDLSADGNNYPDCYPQGPGIITSDGYNLIGDNAGCTFTAATGDQVGTGGSPINALLGPLADNGGGTLTHALLAGSPAIDTANPAGCFTDNANSTGPLTTDQRGFLRPVDGDHNGTATCDIGAYEVGGCGDGHLDPGEQCDDGNLVNGDGCSSTCKLESCGDGVKQPSEDCDNGAANSNTTPDACRLNCKNPGCGDGVIDTGEECDDGVNNGAVGDSCSAACATVTAGGPPPVVPPVTTPPSKTGTIDFILGNGGCSLIRE